jgi:hypothetical protein
VARLSPLLLVIALAACGQSERAVTTTPAATTERAAEAGSHIAQKPTGAERRYVNTVGEWVLACTGTVREYAGVPPSPRTADLAKRATAACAGQSSVDAVLTTIAGYELAWGDSRRLPVRDGKTRVSRIEPRFSAAAAKLAGRETQVRCWSPEDWRAVASAGLPYDDTDEGAAEIAGFVGDDRRVHLSPEVCDALVELVYGDVKGADADVAFAVVALAHETRHAMGELRENRTECWAVQNAERMALTLGADEKLARDLAERYAEDIYPNSEPPYFDEECRNGGALDLRPESSDWP